MNKDTGSGGKASGCSSCSNQSCAAYRPRQGEDPREFQERQRLQSRLCRIGRKVVVMSGKGGVGKSTLAAALATALARAGKRVGLLDIDLHGPSIPTMMGLEGQRIAGPEGEMEPVLSRGVRVASIGMFLEHPDQAVVWRGPMKANMIRQLLRDVAWGELDFLVIDSPPGTGDEPLAACQLIGAIDGAVIVTTPQRVAAVDVRKSITFCRMISVPVLGVVENMSGFHCPHCGQLTPILGSGGGLRMSEEMGVPFLGQVPIDPAVALSGDQGRDPAGGEQNSPAAQAVREVTDQLIRHWDRTPGQET
jgi:Mrp family chromosome partitioning ATPase